MALAGLLGGGLLGAAPAQAAQPSNWSSLNAGIGGANALSTSSLKAATVGSLTQKWSATFAPVLFTDCLGNQSQTYDGDVLTAGSTIVRHQGPVVRAYNAATGAVLWTTDSRKNTTDGASFWRIALTPDRVYVYQSPCTSARTGTITALDARTGALVTRRSGLGSGFVGQFGVISGLIVLPGRVIDATTLADVWKTPADHAYDFYSASSTIAMYQVGGDVTRRFEARRLTDGVVLWSKSGTSELPVAFSSDDRLLFTQNGGLLTAYDPATGVEKFQIRKASFLAASPADVLVVNTSDTTGRLSIDRYTTAGVKTAGTTPQPWVTRAAIAGKLALNTTSSGAKGLTVLNSSTLATVATLAPALNAYQAVPAGARIVVTTLNAAGLPDNGMAVLG